MVNLHTLQTVFLRLSRREKIIFYFTLSVVFTLLFVKLLIEPFFSKNEAQNEEIVEKKKTIKLDLRLLAIEDNVEAEIQKYNSYFSQTSSAEEEITLTLKEIEELATRAGVYIGYIRPGDITTQGIFEKYIVNVSCEGEMAQVVAFIYAIENSEKLLGIEQYTIVPKSEGSSVAQCRMVINKVAIPQSSL